MKTETLQNSSTGDDELSIALLKTIRHRMLAECSQLEEKKKEEAPYGGGLGINKTAPRTTKGISFYYISRVFKNRDRQLPEMEVTASKKSRKSSANGLHTTAKKNTTKKIYPPLQI